MNRISQLSNPARIALGVLAATIAVGVPTAAAVVPGPEAYTLQGAQVISPPGFSPAIKEGGFSGLDRLNRAGTEFFTISDRGPNGIVTVAGKDRRTFLAPAFTPTIYRVKTQDSDHSLRITQRIPLHLPAGAVDPARSVVGGNPNEITGLWNTDVSAPNGITTADEKSWDATAATGLPIDPYGLDTEAVKRDPRDSSFWLVDEYRPSIIHVSKNGTLLSRIIPSGTSIAGHTAVPLNAILPNEWKDRRANRGIEGLALSPSGNTVWVILQNSINIKTNPSDDTKLYRNVRLAQIDVSDPANPVLAHEFIYRIDLLSATVPNTQDALRISELTYLTKNQLLVDERDDSIMGPNKILYAINLKNATDIKGIDKTGIDSLDAAGLALRGIKPVTKRPYVDFGAKPYKWDKLEGIALSVDHHTVSTVDDDDFGFIQNTTTGVVTLGTKPTMLINYHR